MLAATTEVLCCLSCSSTQAVRSTWAFHSIEESLFRPLYFRIKHLSSARRRLHVHIGGYDYFLGDKLGSVRQLTGESGGITLAQYFEPYGDVLASAGTGGSIYGYTGEIGDQTGLTYLRARYYAPENGSFSTRDSLDGSMSEPMSFNRWLYVEANPVNATDPPGFITRSEAYRANLIVDYLKDIYDVGISKDWGLVYWDRYDLIPGNRIPLIYKHCEWWYGAWRNLHELELTREGVDELAAALGGSSKFRSAMKWHTVPVVRVASKYVCGHGGGCTTFLGEVQLPDDAFSLPDNGDWAIGTVAHELAHLWDYRNWGLLSAGMNRLTNSFTIACRPRNCHQVYDPTVPEQPVSIYGENSPAEDWADSIRWLVIPSYGERRPLGPIRRQYVDSVIHELR